MADQMIESLARLMWTEHNVPSLMNQQKLEHEQTFVTLFRAWPLQSPEERAWWKDTAKYRVRNGPPAGGRFFSNQPPPVGVPRHIVESADQIQGPPPLQVQPGHPRGHRNAQQATNQDRHDESEAFRRVSEDAPPNAELESDNRAQHDAARSSDDHLSARSEDTPASANTGYESEHGHMESLVSDRPLTEDGSQLDQPEASSAQPSMYSEAQGEPPHTRASGLSKEEPIFAIDTLVGQALNAPSAEAPETQADREVEAQVEDTGSIDRTLLQNPGEYAASARLRNQQRRRERQLARQATTHVEDIPEEEDGGEAASALGEEPFARPNMSREEAMRRWETIAGPTRARFQRALSDAQALGRPAPK